MSALVICVRMIDGRYHGVGDWPPCPFRLFQALVASAASLGSLGSSHAVFKWFEELPAPTIGAPQSQVGQQVSMFVPNNDLDAKGGDIRRIAEVRKATKHVRPRLFAAEVPLVYVWELRSKPDAGISERLFEIVAGIYQFGRGVDAAYADIEWLDETELSQFSESYSGRWFRPADGGYGLKLRCPLHGSFASLLRRQEGREARFQYQMKGRGAVDVTYRQPPAAYYREVGYESPPKSFVYELRAPGDASRFACWPLESAHALVVSVRDACVERLGGVLRERQYEVARLLIGRKPDGSNHSPATDRVRIVPLPSIGHAHADCGIRRVLVVVPASGTLRADDLDWAFSGLGIVDKETGGIWATLISSRDTNMQRHFGIGKEVGARVWRTLTPMVLPHDVARRSIPLRRKPGEEKAGLEIRYEMERASYAVRQALRMAGVSTPVEAVRMQREPFERNGQRVEAFASGTRFHAQRLWHVEITFGQDVSGPLVAGDGRFMGLGVMAPAPGQLVTSVVEEV